ncbi:uncharacterized protein LOC134662618 [Cydia amplana]|uniref:uncharacterized protein LOC134662618 n=1 Tax=Cydia amplana TaxID=1869771 RepID=UPI002FE57477
MAYRFCTFNCKSVKRSVDCIKDLCRRSDIIALQETWLCWDEIPYLNTIDENFCSTGTSAVDTSAGMLRGRPYGGVGLLWRRSAFQSVSVVQCENARLCAIKIMTADNQLVIVVSVYMPTDCSDNVAEFTDCLAEVSPSLMGGLVTETSNEKPGPGFTVKDIDKVIKSMSRGKSPGHDGLSIEHLQNAGPHISRVLAMFFTVCMRHSYLPNDMMRTIVVPVVKNKTGDLADKNNYRPI